MWFELGPSADIRAARRGARLASAALLQSDSPLMAASGPLPEHPDILNATVWLGSTEEKVADHLELEGIN